MYSLKNGLSVKLEIFYHGNERESSCQETSQMNEVGNGIGLIKYCPIRQLVVVCWYS